MSRRTDQRRAAAFAVYQRELTGRELGDLLGRDASLFTRALAFAAEDYRDELDVVIARHARGWTVERIAPLEPRHTRALIIEAREVGRTAFIGTIATAIVQGMLAGIGYAVLGVPQPVTWAVVTALASFLPVIGTAIVWVPVSAYLVMDGHPVRAVLMAIYGVVIVTSLADYVIRPRIVGSRGHGHPLLTLIALLGGIEVFGLAGLIVAPIVMSVFVAAFRLYEREVRAGGVPGTNPGLT